MSPRVAVAAAVFLAASLPSCVAQSKQISEAWKQEFPPGELLQYGPEKLQFGELRVPASSKGPHPVVILIHGGCWANQIGNRDPRDTSYEPFRPLAVALHDTGVATWNVEYRRAGDAGGGWPGTYQDLSLAVDYLRKIAKSKRLDLRHVVVAGHSSGGHLALWVAARHKIPASSPVYATNPLRVQAVVNLDGPPDAEAAVPFERKFCPPPPAITRFMGGSPAEVPDRYRDGSATSFLPIGVKQVIISAGLLNAAPALAKDYVSKAKGDDISIEILEKTGHFDLVFPSTPDGRRTLDVIRRLAGIQ